MSNIVKAACIQTLVDGHYVHFYANDVLPSSVKGDQLKALIEEGLVSKEEPTEDNTSPDKGAPGQPAKQ